MSNKLIYGIPSRYFFIVAICFVSVLISSCTSSKFVNSESGKYSISLQKLKWSLQFSKNDFTLEKEIHKPDGKAGYFMFTDSESGLNVSVMIEPAVNCADAKSCRDYALNKNQLTENQATNLELTEFGDWSLIEYLVPELSGIKINQQHMYANYVNDGYWIDLHLSKVSYKKSDRKLFTGFLKSVSFTRKSPGN